VRASVSANSLSRKFNFDSIRIRSFRMDDERFWSFYNRYREHCILAGVEPLTAEATIKLLGEWHPDGPFSAVRAHPRRLGDLSSPPLH
jgi:hypothetical protein